MGQGLRPVADHSRRASNVCGNLPETETAHDTRTGFGGMERSLNDCRQTPDQRRCGAVIESPRGSRRLLHHQTCDRVVDQQEQEECLVIPPPWTRSVGGRILFIQKQIYFLYKCFFVFII